MISTAVSVVALISAHMMLLEEAAPTAVAPSIDFAQLNPPRSIEEVAAAARRDVYWLADDAREGRGAGYAGLEQSAGYIAARLNQLGLEPLPGQTDFFQPFDVAAGSFVAGSTSLAAGDAFELGKDFTAMSVSREGAFEGPLAFVGYSARNDEKGYDDFAGIDVKGRVVIALRYEPHDAEGNSRFTGTDNFSNSAGLTQKARLAAEAGAVAILIVNPPKFHDDLPPLSPFARSGPVARLPVIQLTTEAADKLLASRGAPSIARLQDAIDATGKPLSMLIDGPPVKGNVAIERRNITVRNVMAMFPGNGPNKDEYVVVGAHYDHAGRGEFGGRGVNAGQVHNGADDNASGTTTLLQLAQDIVAHGPADRSIIFQFYAAEEMGLLGSAYFTNNPLVPLDQIAAMLNLDMVGRVREENLYIGGSGTAAPFEAMVAAVDDASPLNFKVMGKGGVGPSDHASFARKGIPVLFLFSGLHPEYHTPADKPDTINYEGIAQAHAVAFDLVYAMASMERSPYNGEFDSLGSQIGGRTRGDRPANAAPREQRPQLGVEPAYGTDESTDGVLITGIIANTTAADAGMKGDDVIIQLNDTKIENLYDLTEFLGNIKVGDDVTITVRRGTEIVKLPTTKMKARASAE